MGKGRMPHYAAKRDSNETQIVNALQAVGAVVYRISSPGMADLVVAWRGNVFLLECKTKKGKLTETQQAMRCDWDEYIHIVRDIETALHVIGATA